MNVLKLLGRFFVDDVGEPSCMRLLCFAVVTAVLGIWVLGNIQAGTYQPMGTVDGGLVGVALSAKSLQTRFEAMTYGGGK